MENIGCDKADVCPLKIDCFRQENPFYLQWTLHTPVFIKEKIECLTYIIHNVKEKK